VLGCGFGVKGKAVSFSKLFNRMMETFHEYQWKQLLRSWTLQSKEERRARLRTIIQLSIELDGIRKVSNFAVRIGESAVEAVIEGDWKQAQDLAGDLTFHDDPHCQDAAQRWEPFVLVLRAACVEALRRMSSLEETGPN
jgi:hypothetical protein